MGQVVQQAGRPGGGKNAPGLAKAGAAGGLAAAGSGEIAHVP